jgi:hypothetical protein
MNYLKNLDAVLTDLGVDDKDCHPTLPRGKEYRMVKPGGGAVSIEEAMFLAGTIWGTRPDVIIELGTSQGCSALVMAAACKDLGKGHVITVDLAKDPPMSRFIASKHDLPLTFVNDMHSIEYLKLAEPSEKLQYLLFSDTDIPVRPQEVNLIIEKFPKGSVVMIHDTSEKHPFGPMKLADHVSLPIVELPSPRGISILRT